MIEMSPFYAHDSSVGPVFDVATWSPGKAWSMAVFGFVLAAVIAAALIMAWQPTLLLEKPPEVISGFHKETLKLQKEHPATAYGGTAAVGLFGLLALAGGCASLIDATTGDYHFRAGPGGISVRVPHGLDVTKFCLVFKRLEMEMPLEQIDQWTVVQHKQLGAMSRNAGNVMAFLKVRFVDGKREEFNLDCFREPAHVIHSKINDALQMVPAQFGPQPQPSPAREAAPLAIRKLEAKCDAILTQLSELLERQDDSSSVIFSHARDGKFVQLAGTGHSLLFDLPRQAMDEAERARASEYFTRLRSRPREDYAPDSGHAAVTVGDEAFQVDLADVQQAARLVLEVFQQVYRLPSDFPMVVEHV